MKILYGVQATGNGHITRARAINRWFSKFGIDVDFLFSGRAREDFWDMQEFGEWQCKRGLTFIHKAGNISIASTIRRNSLLQLYQDARALDLSAYDLVLTDFEPITAWASKLQKKPCVGVGHQYAFSNDVPRRGDDFAASAIMKNFAPVSIGLGLHWHHFGGAILPPIAETHDTDEPNDPNKVVVYLGFEDPTKVIELLEPLDNHNFAFYGPFPEHEKHGHIDLKPLSREGFKHDLATAGGVICNAGFELSSEAIQLGKKLLVKPLMGQMEQLSNAEALNILGLGMSMDTLDRSIVSDWLKQPEGKRVIYPDVAYAIVEWLSKGEWDNQNSINALVNTLWQQTNGEGIASFEKAPSPNLKTL